MSRPDPGSEEADEGGQDAGAVLLDERKTSGSVEGSKTKETKSADYQARAAWTVESRRRGWRGSGSRAGARAGQAAVRRCSHHVSHVMCQMSNVTCHMSRVMFHDFFCL